MNYLQLGQSALQISSIGFGCMSLKDEQSATRLIHRAIDVGINFFDTADLYDKGLNEEWVGRVLRGRRDKVVVATKVGNQWREDGSGWDWNPRKDYIIRAVEDSLRRLQTDRIDLYQLHGGTLEDPIDETIAAFELLQEQGKIRYCGLSSIRPNVIREYVRKSHIVSVMMQYSLLDRRPEETCLGLLRSAGIGVLARGVLAKGLLAGKPATPYLDHSVDAVEKAAEAIRSIAAAQPNIMQHSATAPQHAASSPTAPQRTAAAVAAGYVLSHPAVTSVVAGIRTDQQLEELIGGGGEGRLAQPPTSALTNEELEKLRSAVPPNRYEGHL